MSNAFEEIHKLLYPGEKIKTIVFGAYGWGQCPFENEEWELGYNEPDPPLIPFEVRGKMLSESEASKFMLGWSFYGGFGAPKCYATYIWTNKRVFFVVQYDGSTNLDWAPRNPEEGFPAISGV